MTDGVPCCSTAGSMSRRALPLQSCNRTTCRPLQAAAFQSTAAQQQTRCQLQCLAVPVLCLGVTSCRSGSCEAPMVPQQYSSRSRNAHVTRGATTTQVRNNHSALMPYISLLADFKQAACFCLRKQPPTVVDVHEHRMGPPHNPGHEGPCLPLCSTYEGMCMDAGSSMLPA
jgi:hypothetical protein